MEFDWYSLSVTLGVIAIVGFAIFKKVKNISAVAKEAKEAVEAFAYMFHPDSESGAQITLQELVKAFKEAADVARELKKKEDDE